MNFVLNMMIFVLKLMNFVLKMMSFVLKMMNLQRDRSDLAAERSRGAVGPAERSGGYGRSDAKPVTRARTARRSATRSAAAGGGRRGAPPLPSAEQHQAQLSRELSRAAGGESGSSPPPDLPLPQRPLSPLRVPEPSRLADTAEQIAAVHEQYGRLTTRGELTDVRRSIRRKSTLAIPGPFDARPTQHEIKIDIHAARLIDPD